MYFQVKVLVPATVFHPEHYRFTSAYVESQNETTATLSPINDVRSFVFEHGYCAEWRDCFQAWMTQPITWKEASREDYIILTKSLV
ncbi:hypothetical protein ACQ4M4_14150 [Leptolyngbya sp. AN02str]|uniref:hypothetical protein n=1 Tax=Leptolyngbya sp. AN02str TaxID=3423363 RepID=UPI003D316712